MLAFGPVFAVAEKLQPRLVAVPDHANGIYVVDETVGWTVKSAAGNSDTKYRYTVRENNDRVVGTGVLDVSAGSARIETALHEPGMVLVEVDADAPAANAAGDAAADKKNPKHEALLGAAVAPTQIKPAAPRPADFDAFWAGKLAELKKIPVNPVLTPVPGEHPGVELSKFKLESVGGHVQGYLARPMWPGKKPALVILQWAGVYKLPQQIPVSMAEQGWLTVNVDSHDIDPESGEGVSTEYGKIGDKDRETSYFLNMYLRDTRALDYVQSLPDWDGKTIVLMGTSMGGQQSLVTAGLNPERVTAVVVNEPAGADTNGSLHGRKAGYPYWNWEDPAAMKTALYFDPVNFAPRIKAATLIGVGFLDDAATPVGLWTVYNELTGPKEIVPMVESAHNNITPDKQDNLLGRQKQVLSKLLNGEPVTWKGVNSDPAPPKEPAPGDSVDDPGPLANLSGDMRPDAVKAAMKKVADWQLARVNGTYSQDWTFATLYIGMVTASDTLGDARYADFVRGVGEHYGWTLGPRKVHADDQAIGQSYLWLYAKDHKPEEIAPMRAQFDAVMQAPDDKQNLVWWWCDALFMAPPVWAQLAAETKDADYLRSMHREWKITSDLLWDPEEHLFFRDKSYFDKHEKNGKKIFWSRGNGWVMGGLVRTLTFLPKDDAHLKFYEDKFREMAAKAKEIQSEDGLWRPGLLDAADYPYAEVSGSAFFVYATAWGVRTGLLDRATYLPVVEKGWRGLVQHVYADGRLGSIQPIGAAPGAYTPGTSYVFGTGAFLLAGSEVEQLARENGR